MTFLSSSIDWFCGRSSAHMGPHQYVAHDGEHNGRSMSGALLWAESEKETVTADGNMVCAETNLLKRATTEIANYIPLHTDVVDLGPGTTTAFYNKTLPIIGRLQSDTCILVDESIAFLQHIIADHNWGNSFKIKPVVDDFFDNDAAYFDRDSLICSMGSTISNFVGDIRSELPVGGLTKGLSNMSRAAEGGWMLIGFDSDQEGDRIKSFYRGQQLFQLNLFYRMEAELPIDGDFDPTAFDYEPEWIASSGQLAHLAVVAKDMKFEIAGKAISLIKGQRLHIKNSYKFTTAFFESCCNRAGLSVMRKWEDNSPAKIYLLRILPQQKSVPTGLLIAHKHKQIAA